MVKITHFRLHSLPYTVHCTVYIRRQIDDFKYYMSSVCYFISYIVVKSLFIDVVAFNFIIIHSKHTLKHHFQCHLKCSRNGEGRVNKVPLNCQKRESHAPSPPSSNAIHHSNVMHTQMKCRPTVQTNKGSEEEEWKNNTHTNKNRYRRTHII